MTQPHSARDIADDLLDQTGQAMASGDFHAFQGHFSLPLVMETFEGKRLLQTRRDLENVFHAIREFQESNAVAKVVRENVAAEFLDPGTIAATHVSRMLLAGDILFGRPYPAYSVLKFMDRAWKIQFCQYAIDDPGQLNQALLGHRTKTPRVSAAFSSARL